MAQYALPAGNIPDAAERFGFGTGPYSFRLLHGLLLEESKPLLVVMIGPFVIAGGEPDGAPCEGIKGPRLGNSRATVAGWGAFRSN